MRREPTRSEAMLWAVLRRAFDRWRTSGARVFWGTPLLRFPGRVAPGPRSLYAPAARLVVEVDGSVHGSVAAQCRDGHRDAALVRAGLRVLRVGAGEVERDVRAVAARIREAL